MMRSPRTRGQLSKGTIEPVCKLHAAAGLADSLSVYIIIVSLYAFGAINRPISSSIKSAASALVTVQGASD